MTSGPAQIWAFLSSELSESAVFATSKTWLHFKDWFFSFYFRSISKSITLRSQSFLHNIRKFNLLYIPYIYTLYIPSVVEFCSSLEQRFHSAQKRNNDGFWIKTNFLVQMGILLITDFWKESDTFYGTFYDFHSNVQEAVNSLRHWQLHKRGKNTSSSYFSWLYNQAQITVL